MTDIPYLLQSVSSGSVSDRQFLTLIRRELRQGTLDSAALLSALRDEEQGGSLPPALRLEAMQKIQSWSEAPAGVVESEPWGYEESDTVVDQARLRQLLADNTPAVDAWRPDTGTARVGRLLNGRFQLIERIGSGGMSTVFKALDRRRTESQSPDPYVAVKTLNLPAGDHTAALALLQREAHKLQSLSHPNIVRVMDCDRDDALVFMTMEYLQGESLKHRLQLQPQGLSGDEAMRTLAGIGAALIHAHQNHILHGDLKPANVIITSAGQVKVIDFGVARIIARSHPLQAAGAAQDVTIAMTPQYASPEMLAGAGGAPPDERDDVYGLGCIASELFCGVHPFEGRSAVDAQAAGLKPLHGAGLTGRQFRAVRHALQFDRAQRTANVERFLAEFGVDPAGLGEPGRRHQPVRSVGLIIIALLVLGGIALWWFERPVRFPAIPAATVVPATSAVTTTPAVHSVFRDCPTCPLMAVLPAGRFQQGSSAGAPDAVALEYPQHAVAIAQPFAIGVYDVSVAEFREYADATGADPAGCWTYDGQWREHDELNWRHVGFEQGPSHPVTCISWRDAVGYAEWLSRRTGQHYRLPSASEWEYAAGGGSADVHPWGTRAELACQSANVADETAMSRFPGWKTFACRDGFVYTAPVGSFAPNGFGLYDMLGNVFQWTADCWHEGYGAAPGDGTAWQGGDCSRREVRGGSWYTDPAYVRTTYRNRFGIDYRTNTVGLRLVRVIG